MSPSRECCHCGWPCGLGCRTLAHIALGKNWCGKCWYRLGIRRFQKIRMHRGFTRLPWDSGNPGAWRLPHHMQEEWRKSHSP
jgi:hypothetical protein